jgi:RHS repeat-associated protein
VAKTVDGVTTAYVLDPAAGLTQVLQETTDGQTTSYLYGHDLLAQYDSGTWAYHVNDGLGSVRGLADPTGQVVQDHSFSPFGVPLGESGGEPYGFTGEQWDASTGLVFLRARYYQPGAGRFINKDPFAGYAHIPQSLNRWVHVQYNWKEGNDIDWWTKEEFGGVDRPFERAMITQGLLDQGLWRDLTANERGAKFGIRAYHDPLAVP